jgi:hypothetical protein
LLACITGEASPFIRGIELNSRACWGFTNAVD